MNKFRVLPYEGSVRPSRPEPSVGNRIHEELIYKYGPDDQSMTEVRLPREKVDEALRSYFGRLDEEASILGRAVDSLQASRAYDALYISFLQGLVGEEEFAEQSEAMAPEYMTLDPLSVQRMVKIILRRTESEFTPSDLAELLRVERDSIQAAIVDLLNSAPENLGRGTK